MRCFFASPIRSELSGQSEPGENPDLMHLPRGAAHAADSPSHATYDFGGPISFEPPVYERPDLKADGDFAPKLAGSAGRLRRQRYSPSRQPRRLKTGFGQAPLM
jgi:hypothetical protein